MSHIVNYHRNATHEEAFRQARDAGSFQQHVDYMLTLPEPERIALLPLYITSTREIARNSPGRITSLNKRTAHGLLIAGFTTTKSWSDIPGMLNKCLSESSSIDMLFELSDFCIAVDLYWQGRTLDTLSRDQLASIIDAGLNLAKTGPPIFSFMELLKYPDDLIDLARWLRQISKIKSNIYPLSCLAVNPQLPKEKRREIFEVFEEILDKPEPIPTDRVDDYLQVLAVLDLECGDPELAIRLFRLMPRTANLVGAIETMRAMQRIAGRIKSSYYISALREVLVELCGLHTKGVATYCYYDLPYETNVILEKRETELQEK